MASTMLQKFPSVHARTVQSVQPTPACKPATCSKATRRPSAVKSCKFFTGRVMPQGSRMVKASYREPANITTSSLSIPEVIEKLMDKEDLSQEETSTALQLMVSGADAAQISAFLVLLRAKGETPSEVAGLAAAMQAMSVKADCGDEILDIVGTGGDGIGSVNISTGSCLIAAAAGAKVAKHGNRSVSSMCGSADVLEALGVQVDLGPESMAECVNECNMGFMFAPRYHPAMKSVAPVRKSLKVRTAFNLLGPMLNPAGAKYALVGVYSPAPEVLGLMGESLMRLDMEKALIVHSQGLDELTPMGSATIMEVTKDQSETYEFDPLEVGIPRCEVEDLKGGDRFVNAELLRETLAGKPGAIGNALALNAGVALSAAGKADSVKAGVQLALEVQQSGEGLKTLDKWCAKTQELYEREQATAK